MTTTTININAIIEYTEDYRKIQHLINREGHTDSANNLFTDGTTENQVYSLLHNMMDKAIDELQDMDLLNLAVALCDVLLDTRIDNREWSDLSDRFTEIWLAE